MVAQDLSITLIQEKEIFCLLNYKGRKVLLSLQRV